MTIQRLGTGVPNESSQIKDFLHHPRLHRPHCRLRPVIHGQFPEQVLNVLFHGLDADFERPGDLVVGQAESHMGEHLAFPGRQE